MTAHFTSPFNCTQCDPEYPYHMYQYCQETLDDHIILHTLVSSGKLKYSFGSFLCSEFNCTAIFYSGAVALKHLEIHEQINSELKTLTRMEKFYDICDSDVYCNGCYKLKYEILLTTCGLHRSTKKTIFASASEFVQHFIAVHMKTAPKVIVHACKQKSSERIRIKQCSFCGVLSRVFESEQGNSKTWWEDHKKECNCLASYEKIHQELVAKEAIAEFISCYKLANVPDSINSHSLLSSIDNRIVRKIVKRMML